MHKSNINNNEILQILDPEHMSFAHDDPCVPSYIADYALPRNFADYKCALTGQSCRACTYFCRNRLK